MIGFLKYTGIVALILWIGSSKDAYKFISKMIADTYGSVHDNNIIIISGEGEGCEMSWIEKIMLFMIYHLGMINMDKDDYNFWMNKNRRDKG